MVINEGIRLNGDGTISFGNFLIREKLKTDNFEFLGDIYRVKTHDEITRLEKNGGLFVESVPGAAFDGFCAKENLITFTAYAKGGVSVTLELEPDTKYQVSVDGAIIGAMSSGSTGKFIFSLTLNEGGSKIDIKKM